MLIRLECPTDFIEYDLSPHKETSSDDAEIMICNPGADYSYGAKYISCFPGLRMLATPSTGVNHIDTEYCGQRDIKIVSLLDDRKNLNNINASAEFTWLHIMNAVRNFSLSISEVKKSNWRNVEYFLRGRELDSLTLGIIGLGRIGSKVAAYANFFGMKVAYYDPYVNNEEYSSVTLNQIASNSDVIAVCVYLNNETTGMVNKSFLNQCKKGAVVVNTSRGEVVNEPDICEAVHLGYIRYSADVVTEEQDIGRFFKSPLSRLAQSDDVCITPHIAGATYESQRKAFHIILNLIRQAFPQ